ncbi:unnamed protein product [Bursaphelenchus okinawaensis]|uniref:Uncharacterized protein n=1 Tax=Bursaphelenchus okinawaensis TaxID=465554 RepID=A0A811JVB8_9BILA|nr:unnamed protein product [Bursaphelenchus okinawaensis]CAG9085000.1 unnamed protein product [Bursaphelenchus okinawaensis]
MMRFVLEQTTVAPAGSNATLNRWPHIIIEKNAVMGFVCLWMACVSFVVFILHRTQAWPQFDEFGIDDNDVKLGRLEKGEKKKIKIPALTPPASSAYKERPEDSVEAKPADPTARPAKKPDAPKPTKTTPQTSVKPRTPEDDPKPTNKIKIPPKAEPDVIMPASDSECIDIKSQEMNTMTPYDQQKMDRLKSKKVYTKPEPLSAEAIVDNRRNNLQPATVSASGLRPKSPPLETARALHSPTLDPEEPR